MEPLFQGLRRVQRAARRARDEHDESGEVGKTHGAKTHIYIVNPAGVLIYKGAIDDKPSTDRELCLRICPAAERSFTILRWRATFTGCGGGWWTKK